MPKGGGRQKSNHRSHGRHVSSAEDVQERNLREAREAEEEGAPAKGSDEEEVVEEKKGAKKGPLAVMAGEGNPNANKGNPNEFKDGIELTRKQREEIDRAAARRRYEEAHAAGKTDEAKADLARLEAVRKRREEAAQKKLEDAEAEKVKEDGKAPKSGMTAEVKEALGGGAARLKGERSQANREKKKEVKADPTRGAGNDDEFYAAYAIVGKKPEAKTEEVKSGSIDACRDAEDDFM